MILKHKENIIKDKHNLRCLNVIKRRELIKYLRIITQSQKNIRFQKIIYWKIKRISLKSIKLVNKFVKN